MSEQSSPIQNVGTQERIVSAILGTLLLSSALRHRSILLLATVGGLYYRAFSGNCKGYEALGIPALEPERKRSRR